MKKYFTLIVLLIGALTLTGCGNTGNPAGQEKNTEENAVEELTKHLVSMNVMDADMRTDDGKYLEWNTDEIKEEQIGETEIFGLELRFSEDESVNGEMAGRLAGIYGVSKDGKVFYQYNVADDGWEELN